MTKLLLSLIFILSLSSCWLNSFVKPETTQARINDAKVLILAYTNYTRDALKSGKITKSQAQDNLGYAQSIFTKVKLAESLISKNEAKAAEAQMNILTKALILMQKNMGV